MEPDYHNIQRLPMDSATGAVTCRTWTNDDRVILELDTPKFKSPSTTFHACGLVWSLKPLQIVTMCSSSEIQAYEYQ